MLSEKERCSKAGLCGVQDSRDSRQQLLNELDRVRHEREALQEENVHLQSECERLSGQAADLQRRSAGAGNAETDASRDWRVHSHEGLSQQADGLWLQQPSSVGVVTEGFVLPHDVEQLQERVLELEQANRVLRSMHRHVSRSPVPSVASSSDQDVGEGGFIDEKRDDAEISPVPSPDGMSGFSESHSPAYERLKAEFVAYKRKAQKDYAKLKARLVSTVREYNELKSGCALGRSPSQSPVLWLTVSPVAEMLASQSLLSPSNGRHSTSGWHCMEKEVQTDLGDVSRNVDVVDALVGDSRTIERVAESQPSEMIQDIQSAPASREMDSTASMEDRCNALETELSALRSQYSALMQERVSLTELVGRLREEAENRERSSITETPAVVATDSSATADTGSDYQNLISENQRLLQERKMDKSEYEGKLRQLEERCLQENARLKQLLGAVRAGFERSDEFGDGDSSSSCRRCAELAEKCRVLETSAELSGLNAERRLLEAEESRDVAAHLQSRLDQLSGDDKSSVSKTHAGSDNCLLSYVIDNRVVTNTSVADRQDVACDGLIVNETVSSTDLVALPACIVSHDVDQPLFHSPGNDVDLEVAEILEHQVAACNTVHSDLKLYDSVDNDDLSSSFVSCEDFTEGDCRMSYGFECLGEFNGTLSLQAQYETLAVHDSCQSAVTEARLAEYETESTGKFQDDQYLVTESPNIIPEDSMFQQFDSTETATVTLIPLNTASLSENKIRKSFPVTSAKSSGGKTLGNSECNPPSANDVNGSSMGKQPCPLPSSDIVKSHKRDSLNYLVMSPPQMQAEEATIESSVVSVKEQEQAAVDWVDVVMSSSPSGATGSAVMLESVTKVVSQNEEMLRRNRAWTDKLKREYEVAADELRAMKNKYETVVCEKEKVRAHLLPEHRSIKPSGFSNVKVVVKKEAKTTARQKLKDMSVQTAADVSSSEIVEMKIQYEILLKEKSELCRKFEVERIELLKKLEGRERGLVGETETRTLQVADVGNNATEIALKLQEMSHKSADELSCCHKDPVENGDMINQPSITRLHATFNDFLCGPTVPECQTESMLADPVQSSSAASYSDDHVNLRADDAALRLDQSFEFEDSASVAAAAATHSEMMLSSSTVETAPQFDVGVKQMPMSAVDLPCRGEVSTIKMPSSRSSALVCQSNNELTDELHAIKVHFMCNSRPASTADVSAELSSGVHVELELLRLEKKELCTSLEMEERKCAELRQQLSKLMHSVEASEVRSNELEAQLSSATIQLEIVLEEKNELCRQCVELSAEIEAARMMQTEGGSITQRQTSVEDKSIDANTVPNEIESLVMQDVSNNASDASLPAQLDHQELAAKILELNSALECTTAEKLASQEQLECCQEECRRLTAKVEQLTGQLDGVTKSSEDALHAAMSEVQELAAANSSLEITNSSLTDELKTLKSHCCSLRDDAGRLSDVIESLQLELESTNHAKQLLSQRCEELLSETNSMQQHVARLEKENADLCATSQSANAKNECLTVEIAEIRRDCELLSKEKEQLSVENSVAESSRCLLEEQYSKLAEKLRQLECTAAETKQQYDATLHDLHSAFERKQKECSAFWEELSAAKLVAELNALKLHDSLKSSEQQLRQLANAETVIKDLEGKLREKQCEVLSVTDLHALAVSAVDEATSRLVSLQNENEAISARLAELRAEKDELLTESKSKVEALEAEVLRKAAEISSLQEKAVRVEAANEQLLNELHSVNTALCETQHQLQQEKSLHEQQMTAFEEQLAEERASVKVICDAHSAELAKMTSKCTSIELQLSASKTENGDVSHELEQARDEILKWQDRMNCLSSEYQQCKDDAKTQLVEVKSVRDGLADDLAECQQEKKRVEEKLDRLASEFESCKGEMAAVIEEIVVFKQCNDELKLRIAQLQTNEENLVEELQNLRAEHAESCALHRTEMDEQKQVVLRAENERDELRSVHERSCQVIDETIVKYTEVKAQLSQLRQTNNMLMNDLDKSNQRCNVVSSENERLLSDNRELVDSVSSKSAEIGLLVVENKAAGAKIVELSSELKKSDEQLTELVGRESALREEADELKFANLQLLLEREQNQQLLQKLDDSHKRCEEIESDLVELKAAHGILLSREQMLTEEIRLLIEGRDELVASLQSDSQTHRLECEDLKTRITEMEAVLHTAEDNISSLQAQKQDVESICRLLHDCIANCILEALRDVTMGDMEVEAEGDILKEISKSNDMEQLNWLQDQICRKNNGLQSLRDELKTCRECLSSEESLRARDNTLMQKLEEKCKQLEDDLAARSRQHAESGEQHAAAVRALHLQLDGLKHENECLSEDYRNMTDLQSSSQANMSVLADEVTALKSVLRQLEETNAEKEKCREMRDSEFNSLTENYNAVVTEKNAVEAENRSLCDQIESMQKERLDFETQLKVASANNSALEEKLSQAVVDVQQSSQECIAHCVKISELEESLSGERFRSRTLADLQEKYKTLFEEISHAVSSISQKCRSDYPDVASADEVGLRLDSKRTDDVLSQYSHLLSSLDFISNCYKQVTEEQNQQKEKVSALVAECDFLRTQASVDVSVDVGLQELQDEVAQLFQAKTDLENEVMQLRAENIEAKDAHDRREAEAAAEQESQEQKITDLHHLLDMASQSKEALETELLCERNEFERNLAAARCESLLRAGRSEEEQRKIVEQLSDAESQLAGLRDRLRASQDERDLLQLRLAYVTRECTVKEQHLDDLRAQVAAQHIHIQEAMKEHRDTIQLLVELRLEQQLGRREQHGKFSRLEEEILRLESHMESCSSRVGTPRTMSLLNAPASRRPSSVHSLPMDSTCQTDEDTAVKSDHDQTLQPSPDDLAYKALETKHFQLVHDLSELKQQLLDLQEANKCLTNENAVLKQHAASKTPDSSPASSCNVTDHKSSLDFSRRPYRVQSCEQFSGIGSATSLASVDQRVVGINIPVEMVGLQAKLVQLQKDYREVVDENKQLRTSLLVKQDELVKQMEVVRDKQKKRSFRFGSSSASENAAAMTEVSGQQILLLQKERDELRCRLDAARVKEDEAAKLSDKVEQLEDALSRERQKFHELYQEKESIEIQLLQERLTVERHVREFQHLQGLVSKKDRLEQQLHKTSSATVPDSTSSPGTRQILQDKKTQLVVEIRRKILYRDVALQVGDSILRSVRRTQVTSVQPMVNRPPPMAAQRSLRLDCGCITELGTMRMRAGCRYHQAVERLRRELKAQDAAARKTGKRTGIY